MKLFTRYFLLLCALITAIYLTCKHYAHSYPPEFYTLEQLCNFHLGLSTLLLTVIAIVNQKRPKYTGFAFLATAILRFIGVGAFPLPLRWHEPTPPLSDALYILLPLPLLILLEALYTLHLIRNENHRH